MILSKDRSGYFGASDTNYIIGNWNTKSFDKWWLIKLGVHKNNFKNESMNAGTNYEHKILDSLDIPELKKDKQIIIDKLRVNLDGNTPTKIYEVKTYNFEKGFKVPKNYVNQVLVQMYASGIKNACIVAYGLVEKDYKNYFNEIDKERLSFHQIDYDEEFINKVYLPKLNYLTHCLENGLMPKEEKMIETSLMVCDYPEPPEPKTKTIKGRMYLVYKFEMEVPEEWDESDIKNDMYDNISEYQQDLDEIAEIDI